jgi:16S rRNA processing protein RimM
LKSSNKISVPADRILIGKVVAAHGIKGAVRIQSYAESVDLFASGTRLWVQADGAAAAARTVIWVQTHGQKVRMALEGIGDRNAAEALVGASLFIERALLPDLEADT